MRLLAAALACLLAAPAHGQSCSARSAAGTAALVELYTSEGCDACPPADRWLSSLASRGQVPGKVVPIALHVDYWDYIGWKDPWAKREFSLRQRLYAQLKRARLVYTPQVLLQGRDFRGWATGAFDQEVARINALPAAARIALTLTTGARREDALAVETTVELLDPSRKAEAGNMAVFLAAYENKLQSEVRAGENRGKTLAHDFVVFEWQGPLGFGTAAQLQDRRMLPPLPQARDGPLRRPSGVVAFVQNRATGEVLQALMLPACAS